MRYLIEGSNRFYFNDELLCFEFCTVTNKYKIRDILDDGSCLYSVIDMLDSTKTNRIRKINMSIAFAYCLYVLKYITSNDFVIKYKDGNYHNISSDNIIIEDLFVYGDKWVEPTQFSGKYKLCSNGIVYDCKKHSLVSFSNNGSYYSLGGFNVHRLVWDYFGSEPYKESMVIDHIDNNICNNDINNLQLITQNKNIKKERNSTSKNGNIMICYNGKHYYLGKRKYHTSDECDIIYNNALKYVEDETIENYFCDHDYIRYDFLKCGWKIISLPSKKEGDIIDYSELLFDTYDSCLNYFNELLNKFNLTYYIIGSKEYYLDRNVIRFKINDNKYTFNLLKNNKAFSEKVIDYYLENGKEKFLERIEEFTLERDKLKAMSYGKEKVKVKNIFVSSIKEECIKIDYSDFNSKPNYVFQNSKQTYVFNIPYNGDFYLLGSIADEELVNKIDDIIKLKKNDNNFLLWLKDFKDNDFLKYQKESENKKILLNRLNSKGYYYFKSRNCWKSHITHNGVKYMLGYFKHEVEADCIYKEATNMIEYGIFEKWYKDIKEHQKRIKYIFES